MVLTTNASGNGAIGFNVYGNFASTTYGWTWNDATFNPSTGLQGVAGTYI